MANRIVLFGSGFLWCVLWMDLKFDSLVWRLSGDLPEEVLSDITAYYSRALATEMGFVPLIAPVMLVMIIASVWQVARGGLTLPLRVLVPVLMWPPITMAMTWIVPTAVTFAEGTASITEQSAIAREIFLAHVYCFVSIGLLTITQLWIGKSTQLHPSSDG